MKLIVWMKFMELWEKMRLGRELEIQRKLTIEGNWTNLYG